MCSTDAIFYLRFPVADRKRGRCVKDSISQHALPSRPARGPVRGAESPLVLNAKAQLLRSTTRARARAHTLFVCVGPLKLFIYDCSVNMNPLLGF